MAKVYLVYAIVTPGNPDFVDDMTTELLGAFRHKGDAERFVIETRKITWRAGRTPLETFDLEEDPLGIEPTKPWRPPLRGCYFMDEIEGFEMMVFVEFYIKEMTVN